jgi:hypothetical protein
MSVTKGDLSFNNITYIVKGNSPVNIHEESRGRGKCWASLLTLTPGKTWTAQLSARCSGRTLTPRKILGTHFGGEFSVQPDVDSKNRSLENL